MRRCSPYCAPVAVCVVTVVTAVRGCVTEPLSPKNSAASPGFTAGAIPLENSKNTYKIKPKLQYDVKSYCMEYYFETKIGANFDYLFCLQMFGKSFDWNSTFHDLQLCFGVKEFLFFIERLMFSLRNYLIVLYITSSLLLKVQGCVALIRSFSMRKELKEHNGVCNL
ncbi:hypothetical protein Ahy_B01g054128 isoform A [Arachis hypogaea]|uniref:Uncharacterized protein n=1 Tax=Arachis hypogaea TaxID=3818 RepID=A0A445ATD0_ARAHY|nr:hypothetical protein Ahy_B01g054128 isoform A [Arachis hypogaea]